MLALAWCHLHREDAASMEQALELLQERFPQSPLAPRAAMMFADYHYNQADYERARQAYEGLSGAIPKARKRALVAAAGGSGRPGSRSPLPGGHGRLRRRRLRGGARRQLEEVVKRFPGTLSEMAARCNIGVCYEKTGQWRRAAAVYDSLLQRDEADPQYGAMLRFAREHRD